MIKIPKQPFIYYEAGDDHPLVAKALRRHKHYELCWCGSGKKYKKCHSIREAQEPLELGQMLYEQDRIFWRSRGCMHPMASETSCNGRVVDSHTIQRNGPLERIIDHSNHVLQFKSLNGKSKFDVVRVGWRHASTFPGYCSKHDSSLFRAIETQDFTGEHEQCILLAFRNLCNELYRKRALVDCLDYQRAVLDRGRNLDQQIEIQLSVSVTLEGQLKSIQESEKMWEAFEHAITTGDYSRFVSRSYFFKGKLAVVSTSVFQCEFNFEGQRLVDLHNLDEDADLLSHSIIDMPDGGAIIFVWLKEAESATLTIDSFNQISDKDKCDIFIQYCFLNSENTYFSQDWWNGLSESSQEQVRSLAGALHYEGGAFVANSPPLVDWIICAEK